MVRPLGFLVGLGFIAALVLAILTTPLTNEPNASHEFHKHPKHLKLASDGLVPHWDKAQLQRGMQVYKEVCSACHSLNLVAFRNIQDLGYTEGQVKSFAKSYDNIPSINPDTGEPATRTGLPSDHFPAPYANEVAARAANNNALPPDLSLITKAREGGKDYIYSLLTGFQNPPANLPKELRPGTGLHYNPYFANLNLAMAPPLADGQVTYADGTKATVDQMASDVTAFLVWTAEPKLVKRVQVGWGAFIFLLIFSTLTYLSYRNIWADKEH
ncbi:MULTISPECIES: cytochrome c1 [Sphingopyxis]|jgi:ubiquinol-cytochrome c reductase cytochrome c1 subunit|uniref:Cytochrome c1 n=1 Tax=Sphingopyxis granuli TaxID=267128 RepID=A0AA86GKC1_9SPHN|nr:MULTISPECIES: cytochrome c1 [Sphingopyxis]AMG74504.1 Cytochrome c1 [Sphingopyxis granuli]APW72670.1 cytochrome c1 [Sphingopyxis granuli]AVA13845.1 cytochrome c1 [Sphingopyxis sp. MG]ODU29205.1 MAG: cytochrome C [Sphingopyxis sp. SCN 67-31]QUM71110.1 cytochrome c1 [Sphingopyxis granuli]